MRVIAWPVGRCSVRAPAAEIEPEPFPTCPLMRVHWGRCNLPVGAKKLGTHHCIKEQKSALNSMFFPNGPDDELQIIGFLWMENKESCLFLHIGCESKICSSPCEVPDLSKQWNPGQLTCRLKAASPERARFCVCSLSTPIRNRRCAMER